MNQLKQLTQLLGKITQVSENIIRTSVQVMRSILNDKNNTMELAQKKYPDLGETELKQKLQTQAQVQTVSQTSQVELGTYKEYWIFLCHGM